MANNVELRPDCNLIISRSNAYDFLSQSKSEIESITAKYYEIVTTSSKYTGHTSNVTISDMFDRIADTFGEATAILGSTTSAGKSSDNQNNNSDVTGPSAVDTDTIAGETTSGTGDKKNTSTNIDVVGLAVFRDDVLVR